MRPLILYVDHETDPPIVSVLLVGRPHRVVSWQLATRGPTRTDTEVIAVAEVEGTPRDVLEAIAADRRL